MSQKDDSPAIGAKKTDGILFIKFSGKSKVRTAQQWRGVWIVLTMLATLALCASYEYYNREKQNYIIYIDAGSSGSRLHVHNFDAVTLAIAENRVLPSETFFGMPALTKKVTPGLNHMYREDGNIDVDTIHACLSQILSFAANNIPAAFHSSTPLYVGATGGLRTLPETDVDIILQAVRNACAASPFAFKEANVRIISGIEEGIYGWLAANHFSLTLGNNSTFGVLELGGASLQVTFAKPVTDDLKDASDSHLNNMLLGSEALADNGSLPLHFFGQSYHVYSKSYINYGMERAKSIFNRKFETLISTNGNPCYNRGIVDTDFRGTGDYIFCSALIARMFAETPRDELIEDSFALEPLRPLHLDSPHHFLAVENFFYTPHFFGIDSSVTWLIDLEKKGREFCSLDWSEIVRRFPDEPQNDLVKYCFSSAYLPTLMKVLLQSSNDRHLVRTVKYVRGVSIDWAHGAVLLHVMSAATNHLINRIWRSASEVGVAIFALVTAHPQLFYVAFTAITICFLPFYKSKVRILQ